MSLKKHAIFDLSTHPVDLIRHKMLGEFLGYAVKDDAEIQIIDFVEPDIVLVTDALFIKNLFKLLVGVLKKRELKVEMIVLELYSVSIGAVFDELQNFTFDKSRKVRSVLYNFYLLFFRLFKCVLIMSIIKLSGTKLYIPSELRIRYLRKRFKKLDLILLRNLPVSDPKQLDSNFVTEIVGGHEYFYLPGRINANSELLKIIKFAFEKSIKVIVSSSQKVVLTESDDYSSALIETGLLPHEHVEALMRNCLAGIVLYSNRSINQKYAASSKLYEFFYMDKYVITSENPGVEDERVSTGYTKLIRLKDLSKLNIQELAENKKIANINKEYLFKNSLLKLQTAI